MMKIISFVIPAFNEEQNLVLLHEQICRVMRQLSYDYEMILVNDGSRDMTWNVIMDLGAKDRRVKGINFSRNFGHQMALTAGYNCAKGSAIISMDADLQDPPEVLVKMIRKWEEGADIVYARRLGRDDGFIKKITATWYYKLLDAVADVKIPRNVGDFRLLSARTLAVVNQCKERSRYLRGLVAWIGFKAEYVDFVRPNRLHGISGYSWKKMLQLAFDGLTGFSTFPLKLAGYIGGLLSVCFGSYLLVMLVKFLIGSTYYSFETWLTTLLIFFVGVQCILLWFLGEYIGRIYDEQKKRPLYVISDVINLSESRDLLK